MQETTMELITCENASFAYDGKTVVRDVSFAVPEGDFLCIVGENGSGKSTLLKGLLGLLAPSSGRVSRHKSLAAGRMGYMPQYTAVQKDFPATAWEVVLSGCLNALGWRPFFGRREILRAQEAMETLNISHLSGRCFRELSGGERQRVLLARAFCAAEKVLVLDEPDTGLDQNARAGFHSAVADLNRMRALTIIAVTHDPENVKMHARHMLRLGKGCYTYGTVSDNAEAMPCLS